MRELLGHFALLNRASGKEERAELYSQIDAKNLSDFTRYWRPMVAERLSQLPRGATPADANLQDWHWDWAQKAEVFTGRLAYRSFALEHADRTQGLMVCSLVRRVREKSRLNQHLVYIEFVQTAPWNNRHYTTTPVYKGVGNTMVAAAISLSLEEEFEGRIGLHSLPQSEAWYREYCQMTDLGVDDQYQGLRYFEMTSEQAARFLK